MRQDFFEFVPQFKLFISGNHKPGLRSVDEAIRRRFHLIPFTVTIPKAERDDELPEKLKAEWPGILAWMIEGCLDWQRIGLNPPKAVTDATEEYLEVQDAISGWLEDRCDVEDPEAKTQRARLFESWKAWAERAREPVTQRARFFDALEGRGFRQERLAEKEGLLASGTRVFKGIGWKGAKAKAR